MRHVVRILAALLVGSALLVVAPARAEKAAPTISIAETVVRPGDSIVVHFHHWQNRSVTLTTCGNLARRGSADCDIPNSVGVPLDRQSPDDAVTDFVVTTPPVPCPCTLRASDSTQSQVGFAPIAIEGFLTGPVETPADVQLVEASVSVRRASAGLWPRLRAAAGGPGVYDLTVVVENHSAETLSGLEVQGYAGRSATDRARSIELADPGPLAPGATWRRVVRVDGPSPHVGDLHWSVAVTGRGPAASATATSRSVPLLLLLLVVVLVADVAMIVGRTLRRRGLERREGFNPGARIGHVGFIRP